MNTRVTLVLLVLMGSRVFSYRWVLLFKVIGTRIIQDYIRLRLIFIEFNNLVESLPGSSRFTFCYILAGLLISNPCYYSSSQPKHANSDAERLKAYLTSKPIPRWARLPSGLALHGRHSR